MGTQYDILHTTVYRYQRPVQFGLHRVMFRPRDSHDFRVLATDLLVTPPATIRLIQDPHSNSVALVQPQDTADELRIVCTFTVEHVPGPVDLLTLDPTAELLPFAYSPEERLDLEHYLRPHHEDPDGELMQWAQQFLQGDPPYTTRATLERMNHHIGTQFRYQPREEEGTQTPLQTLALGSGSCRDYALLMMEAVRRLGIAARFVSGYLYDPALDMPGQQTGNRLVGAGATHAWVQAYLPGAGWVGMDPTNDLMGSSHLLRVAVARDPSLASPISGTWLGAREEFLGMEVAVKVTRRQG
jgi:transglutaminase-like putative cysteine protease